MAKLYADNNGRIIRFLRNEEEEDWYPNAPVGAVHSLEYDPRTNPLIGQRVDSDHERCRVIDSEFRWDGVAQTISPSGPITQYAAVKVIWAKLKDDQAISAAEVRAILRFLIRRSGVLRD